MPRPAVALGHRRDHRLQIDQQPELITKSVPQLRQGYRLQAGQQQGLDQPQVVVTKLVHRRTLPRGGGRPRGGPVSAFSAALNAQAQS
jgi:hypothetical protein